MGYNTISQLLKEKVQRINILRERKKTYKYIPYQIDNRHQHKYQVKYS